MSGDVAVEPDLRTRAEIEGVRPHETFAGDAVAVHDWVTRWRIPLVDSAHPWWSYEVVLVVPLSEAACPPNHLYRAVWPTEEEAEIIGAAIETRVLWYREGYRARLREREFDIDGGTNTLVLCKQETGWRWRMSSFTDGGLHPRRDDKVQYAPDKAGLIEMLDTAMPASTTWQRYKDDHPEMFA